MPPAALAETPPLSLESLFHPQQRFDYGGPSLPTTRWSVDDQGVELAIRRDRSWLRHDLETHEELSWQGPESWKFGLRRLEGGLAVLSRDGQTQWLTRQAKTWRHPTLSPDGKWVAFVETHDLFVVHVETGKRIRLTTDGSETLLNGQLDWSYQEEIYGRGNFKAFWWSPDSERLAFLRLDIQDVLPYTLVDSQTPRGKPLVTRYPKAGDPIPEAQLIVAELNGDLQLIHGGQPQQREQLIVRVSWHPSGREVVYQVMDRLQSWLELNSCPVVAVTSPAGPRLLLRDTSQAWVEILGEPHWLPAGDFLWLSDQPLGRRRIWRIDADGRRRAALTPADFDVRAIVHVAKNGEWVYFTGDRKHGSQGQQLYRVFLPTENQELSSPETTEIQQVTAQDGWHDATFSPCGNWVLDRYSTLQTPFELRLLEIAPHRDAGGPVASSQLLAKSNNLPGELLPVQWLRIPTTDDFHLPACLIKPQKTTPGMTPVLIETYGGPQAASVVDRWLGNRYLYRQYLAQQGIAVLVVDNRSSAGRGIADTYSVHRRVGVVELQDTLAAVTWLRQQPWVNPDAVALRGWSFGGFLTTYALTHSTAFAAGIAGGSVTDWRNYDAIYTERYMGLPEENAAGYDETSVHLAAEHLHGSLLLIHGELDDNVHPANTLQLTRALQRAGKPFQLMIYPGAKHGITDPDQVYHMMTMVTDFLQRQLTGK